MSLWDDVARAEYDAARMIDDAWALTSCGMCVDHTFEIRAVGEPSRRVGERVELRSQSWGTDSGRMGRSRLRV